MDSNYDKEKKEASLMEEKTVIYGYNDENPKDPEETETVFVSINQSKSTTKRYKGVWRRNGRWTARIRNPLTNFRVSLGKFHSSEAALHAYFSKKREFESKLRATKVSNSVMIDSNGILLGEFSRLDDDLRISD